MFPNKLICFTLMLLVELRYMPSSCLRRKLYENLFQIKNKNRSEREMTSFCAFGLFETFSRTHP